MSDEINNVQELGDANYLIRIEQIGKIGKSETPFALVIESGLATVSIPLQAAHFDALINKARTVRRRAI